MDTPEILAPAGDTNCFLAALGAGADAIYLGLKHFSARMEAENFGLGELARLTELAHNHNCRVYVAMNTLIKPREITAAYRLAKRLTEQVLVDGLIVQDLAMLDIARQTGFTGNVALSTLANVSNPKGLQAAKKFGANRVILPRELSIDEMKSMGNACPPGLELECFVHGALCYCVSGRCYWSSYMGGKSGLRGRCAQPCRRVYSQKSEQARYFACQDLALAEVAKTLLNIPNLVSWKIEGRKKGPHYVFHAVTAYRIIRDNPSDGRMRRMAAEILDLALGRPGVKANFLPQRPQSPLAQDGQTSSGRLAGNVKIAQDGRCLLKPHYDLLPSDLLRIGVEDERWHAVLPVTRRTPKGASLYLRLPKHKTPKAGTPVYLIDRREPELQQIIDGLKKELAQIPEKHIKDVESVPKLPKPVKPRPLPDMAVSFKQYNKTRNDCLDRDFVQGLWLDKESNISNFSKKIFFWLPPVIWPDEEEHFSGIINKLWQAGARNFVCNAPWQRAFFPEKMPSETKLIAGPFCNIANVLALGELKKAGYCAAFISPELAADDILSLPRYSPLPLGLVINGYWPVGISRFGLATIQPNQPFASPKGEIFWARQYGENIWLYPNWPLNLCAQKKNLMAAGYSFFASLDENKPSNVPEKERAGLFNWNGALL